MIKVFYIKKNDKYLAYQIQADENDYIDDVSDHAFNMSISGSWYFTDDIEKAKSFLSRVEARVFLLKKSGEFWRGAEVDSK